MVGNMIRVLLARMTLLAVDEAGMSTVEYSVVELYTPQGRKVTGPRLAVQRPPSAHLLVARCAR